MPKLTSDGINAQSFSNFPKDWYEASVKGASLGSSKATGAPMAIIDWKPEKGDLTGDVSDKPGSIREWVMVSGNDANGNPYRTDKFYDRLDALKLKRDYKCCNTVDSTRPFVIKKEDGKYHCPHCGKQVPGVDFFYNDDADRTLPWEGLKARIQVTIEKQDNSDEERNRINRVTGLPTR